MLKFFKLLDGMFKVLTQFLKETQPEYLFDKFFVMFWGNLSLWNFGQDVVNDKTEVLYDLN